jgi:hypothetical protein
MPEPINMIADINSKTPVPATGSDSGAAAVAQRHTA